MKHSACEHTRDLRQISARRRKTTDRLTLHGTSLAAFDGCTGLHLPLLELTTFPGPLCSLPALLLGRSMGPGSLSLPTCILDPLTLLPLLTCLHNTHLIVPVGFQCGLVSSPPSQIPLVSLSREQK